MNKEMLQTQWPQIRELLREKFRDLTEDDINQINGRYDQLVAKLQQKYGYSRDEAEERIRNWNFDRFTAASPGRKIIREDTLRGEELREDRARGEGSSIFKWLLGLGIPLLLLGAYFLSNANTPVVKSPPPVMNERVVQTPVSTPSAMHTTITQTPADLIISDGLRDALVSAQPNMAAALRNIQITTQNGVVTLSGIVPNQDARDFVVQTSQNHAGVRQVIDKLQVR